MTFKVIDTDTKLVQLTRAVAMEVRSEISQTREQNGKQANAGDYLADLGRRFTALAEDLDHYSCPEGVPCAFHEVLKAD